MSREQRGQLHRWVALDLIKEQGLVLTEREISISASRMAGSPLPEQKLALGTQLPGYTQGLSYRLSNGYKRVFLGC